jgi:hypothetical protein
MSLGYTTALGLVGHDSPRTRNPDLVFVVPGERTSLNPIKAFKQGLEELPANKAYRLHGYRCPKCGSVELVALDQIPWDP